MQTQEVGSIKHFGKYAQNLLNVHLTEIYKVFFIEELIQGDTIGDGLKGLFYRVTF